MVRDSVTDDEETTMRLSTPTRADLRRPRNSKGCEGQVLMFILVSGIPDGSASLRTASFFVSQTRVPEPSVLLLLLAAGAGALARGVRGRS
jgi:hypothetical protein